MRARNSIAGEGVASALSWYSQFPRQAWCWPHAVVATRHLRARGGEVVKGATVTVAEAPGAPPAYIFPLYPLAYYSTNDTAQLEVLLYQPLYWFGKGNSLDMNQALSLADPPVYSDNDRTVTIG